MQYFDIIAACHSCRLASTRSPSPRCLSSRFLPLLLRKTSRAATRAKPRTARARPHQLRTHSHVTLPAPTVVLFEFPFDFTPALRLQLPLGGSGRECRRHLWILQEPNGLRLRDGAVPHARAFSVQVFILCYRQLQRLLPRIKQSGHDASRGGELCSWRQWPCDRVK